MSGPPAATHPDALCPRCGYDLRTSVAEWTESCPLHGRCVECGLEFEWGELLNPRARPPKWNVEFCPLRRWPVAVVCTLAALLAAWPLWRRLHMSMAWRPRRLAAFIASLLLLLVAIPWLGNATLALRFWWRSQEPKAFSILPFDRNLPPRTHPPGTSRGPQLPVVLFEALFLPLASRSNATVVIDGHELPCPAPRTRLLTRWRHRSADAWSGSLGVRWDAMAGRAPESWVLLCKGPQPSLPSPWQGLDPNRGIPGPPSVATYLRFLAGSKTPTTATPILLQCAAMAAIFALLPTTRRRCKVRWQHVARIACYSLALPILLVGVVPLLILLLEDLGPLRPGSREHLLRLTPLLHPAIQIAWWAAAIHLYLRMPHALAIAALAALGGTVLACILFWETMLADLLRTVGAV